jgi:hypothetical protein
MCSSINLLVLYWIQFIARLYYYSISISSKIIFLRQQNSANYTSVADQEETSIGDFILAFALELTWQDWFRPVLVVPLV